MRLRLRIERHTLPPVQAVWPIANTKSTVAQLLESINGVFPLEADTWGLEDYSVTLQDFELLHYHEITGVCKDEDEIVIKPLTFRDLRARTLTGRDQITADGRHLLDGVPFGKPALKGPMRPELRIPQRGLAIQRGDDAEDEDCPLALTEYGEEGGEGDDDDDDDDFEAEVEEDESDDEGDYSLQNEGLDEILDDHAVQPGAESNKSEVSSSGSESSSDSDSDSSSDSDSGSGSESSSGESSSSSGSSSSNSKIAHSKGRPRSQMQTTPNTEAQNTATLSAKLGGKRKLGADSTNDANGTQYPTDDRQGKRAKLVGIPFAGLSKTKARNARRRDTNRLRYLVQQRTLPEGSTLQDLKEHDGKATESEILDMASDLDDGEDEVELSISGETRQAGKQTNIARRNVSVKKSSDTLKILEQEISTSKQTTARPVRKAKTTTPPEDLENARQYLLAQIAAGGVDITAPASTTDRVGEEADDEEPPEKLSSNQLHQPPNLQTSMFQASESSSTTSAANAAMRMIPPSVARRSKLDVASSQRLLFGSLGVRVPKTTEERANVQLKLAGNPRGPVKVSAPNGTSGSLSVVATASVVNDEAVLDGPDAWRAKIRITAVECCDENIVLSEPPFPFRQRWHGQKGAPRSKKQRKIPKHHGAQTGYVETYDKYNQNGGSDALDYDDANDESGEYWDDSALLNGDWDEDVTEQDGFEDDLPPLPANIEDLPPVVREELRQGDLIAIIELACDAMTNWEPKMVTRTAIVTDMPDRTAGNDENEQHFSIQLAQRDLVPVEYDEEGKRVWAKFEMPGDDAPSTLEGSRSLPWSELCGARLLLRRSAT